MGGSAHASFTVGALVLGGGIAGYIRAKSRPSLIAGLSLGTLFILSGVIIQRGDDFKGHALALATSGLMLAGMTPRAVKSRKPVPMVLSGLAAISTAYHTRKVMEWS